jgi:hypothetical protein
MKKVLIVPLLLSLSSVAFSGPYIMSKHELKMKDTNYDKTINHIRFGNSWNLDGLKLYGELGVVEEVRHGSDIFDGKAGTSYQFGFSKKITDNFSWKGKWEGTEFHDSNNSHKIEIKTKWKF